MMLKNQKCWKIVYITVNVVSSDFHNVIPVYLETLYGAAVVWSSLSTLLSGQSLKHLNRCFQANTEDCKLRLLQDKNDSANL